MAANFTPSKLYIGSAYYPEQWPEASWQKDIQLMQEAGFNVARMGEFAWSTLEPSAGNFNFDWLERAITLLAEAGIDTVLGTPTAAPPAWLVQQSPDVLAIDESGKRVQFGNRCHYCVNSVEFHTAVRRLVSALAERFGSNPHVIGWQLDNEYNRYCYCEHCQRLFHTYLEERYGSLENLNTRWTTAYWSQTYSAWNQIPLPIGPHNPGLMLEFKHFITESYRRFQRLQIDTLRPRIPANVWITHNFMDWHDGYDHYRMSEDLDIAAWDWYVGTGHLDPLFSGAAHDLVRGYKRRNFWLMETQSGNVNWRLTNNTVNQGETRTMAWHAIAHGADAILYWQWRSPLGGQEQYHGTLLDQSGQPRLFYQEAQQIAQDINTVSGLLAGSQPVSQVALLNSYDSRWSIQWQRHHQSFDYVDHLRHYYRPLAARNISTDILSAEASLAGYKLVIAPALVILSEACAQEMKAFVENGGHLVLTLRTGMKDEYNALLPLRQPGWLADLAGAEVEEYYALDEPVPVISGAWNGISSLWAERLRVRGPATRVLATYGACNGWLDGQPAITEHSYGKGRVTLVGAYLDAESQQRLLDEITRAAHVHPDLEAPTGVEIRRRLRPDGQAVFIVINHARIGQGVYLPWTAREHLSGRSFESVLPLAPYGIAIITQA
jgi:beta-galactosidase